VGPDAVRRAVLDAAADLFAHRGVDAVSLRAIAEMADVDLGLIRRYVGTREDLVLAVFDDLSERLAQRVLDTPLGGQGHGPDTLMGQWVRVAASLTIAGRPLAGRTTFNPVRAMAQTLEAGYGQDPQAARLRAAQIVGAALGWRIFEDYLVEAGGLGGVSRETLREELVHTARRTGATPWPSPPDPTSRTT
jgi:AcrR family transcriptional regulator